METKEIIIEVFFLQFVMFDFTGKYMIYHSENGMTI